MCFNGYMSGGFAALGLFLAYWIDHNTSNRKLAIAVFFFFTMEFLQAIQYMFLASDMTSPVCATMINKVLTLLGFIHICMQPYFCHQINESLSMEPSKQNTEEHNKKLEKYQHQYTVVRRLCLIAGFLLFIRWPMSYVPGWNTQASAMTASLDRSDSVEWLRGPHLCTFKSESMVHLGWSVPMSDSTYTMTGIGLHAFAMFAPFFALYDKKGMVLQGIFLWMSGPGLSSMITSNLMEQASIWCFMSIAQIAIMLFLIRETLIVKWSKGGVGLMDKDGKWAKNGGARKLSAPQSVSPDADSTPRKSSSKKKVQ